MDDLFGSTVLPSMKERQRKLCKLNSKPAARPVYHDANNIGTRLLSKMGWSEGKGLGVNEDGMSAPILPKYKKDIEGFGYAGEKDDQWTQHDQSFNDLLKSLNGGSNSNSGDEINIKSLEQQSKNSKSRVHYKKFTRGKDLSRASERDLANIFGKKSLNEFKTVQPITPENTSCTTEKVEEQTGEDSENVSGLTTIKASVTVQDYFKAKMLAKTQELSLPSNKRKLSEDIDESVPNKRSKKSKDHKIEEMEDEDDPIVEVTKKKKKSKKNKEIEELVSNGDHSEEVLEKVSKTQKMEEPMADADNSIVEETKKRKKSKKNKEIEELVSKGNHSEEVLEEVSKAQQMEEPMVDVDDSIVEETKKQNKSKNTKEIEELVSNGNHSEEVLEEVSEAQKIEELVPDADDPIVEVTKKKKKSKKNKEIEELDLNENHSIDLDEVSQEAVIPRKSKKSSTKREETLAEQRDDIIADQALDITNYEENIIKKSKKDRKIEREDTQEECVPQEMLVKKLKKSKKGKEVVSEEIICPEIIEKANIDVNEDKMLQLIEEQKDHSLKKTKVDNTTDTINLDEPEIKYKENTVVFDDLTSTILQQLDQYAFAGSNFPNIIGYGLTSDTKLVKRNYHSQRAKLFVETSVPKNYKRKIRRKLNGFTSI